MISLSLSHWLRHPVNMTTSLLCLVAICTIYVYKCMCLFMSENECFTFSKTCNLSTCMLCTVYVYTLQSRWWHSLCLCVLMWTACKLWTTDVIHMLNAVVFLELLSFSGISLLFWTICQWSLDLHVQPGAYMYIVHQINKTTTSWLQQVVIIAHL